MLQLSVKLPPQASITRRAKSRGPFGPQARSPASGQNFISLSGATNKLFSKYKCASFKDEVVLWKIEKKKKCFRIFFNLAIVVTLVLINSIHKILKQ